MENLDSGVLRVLISDQVQKTLFASNLFLERFVNMTNFLNYRTVSIPNFALDTTSITVNQSDFTNAYAGIAGTQQTPQTFTTDIYRLPAKKIEFFQQQLSPYDAVSLQVEMDIKKLATFAGSTILVKLATLALAFPAKHTYTTGAVGSANGAGGGNKKAITFNDLISLKVKMDLDNVGEDRILVINPIQYGEMLIDTHLSKFLETNIASTESGKFERVAGFDIYRRSTVVSATINGTSGLATAIKAVDAVSASTDAFVAIAFECSIPMYALGEPNVFMDVQPQVFGNVLSVEQPLACTNPRLDGKGTYLLIQGA